MKKFEPGLEQNGFNRAAQFKEILKKKTQSKIMNTFKS